MASATDDAAPPAPAPSTSPAAPAPEPAHAPAASEAPSTLKAPPAEAPASNLKAAPAAAPASPKPAAPTASGNSSSTRKKAGFMSKLKGVLLSCVGPSAAHPPDEPASASPSAPPAATSTSAPATEEKAQPVPAAPAPKTQEASEATVAPPVASAPHHGPDSLDAGVEAVTNPSTPVLSAAALITSPPSPAVGNEEADVVVPPAAPATLPEDETAGVTSGAVVPPGASADSSLLHAHDHSRRATTAAGDESEASDASAGTDDDEDDGDVEMREHEEDEDDEDRLIMNGGAGIPIGPDGVPRPLLPPVAPQHLGRKCLVLDLDETLLHSSFKAISQADFIVPVEIEYHWHNVYVIKRPGVDQFLKKMGEIYEIVIFTASLSKYADPVLDKLDIHRVCTHRLFRESCYNHRGTSYVKDLSQLGRPIADTIILDNSPASYIFHPNNAVPVSSWFNDPHDTELTDLCPFLTDLATVDDVRGVLDGGL